MAKATTAKPKGKKKAAKADKAVAKSAPKVDKRKKVGTKAKGAADALWKLAEHPLVGELLAVGATAAVAAIAEGSGKAKKKTSSKAVKAAGKAAAAAIGARLISEFAEGTVKSATKSAKS